MLTTTPFFSPRAGQLPMPMMSRPRSGVISATIAAIFDVPMSSPTTSFLLSLPLLIRPYDAPSLRSGRNGALIRLPALDPFDIALSLGGPVGRRFPFQLWYAHREAVSVSQVDVIDAAVERAHRAFVHFEVAREARFHLFASELERGTAFEPHLPRAPRRHLHHRRL